jgi:hypothetical protein
MNDNELFDRVHSATALTSTTDLADVQARGERLSRRRYGLTAGVGALVAVAAVGITVASVNSGHHSAPAAIGTSRHSSVAVAPPTASGPSSASSPTKQIDIRTAAFEVKQIGAGKFTVTLAQLIDEPTQLQAALNQAGIKAVVRVGAQSCAYQVDRSADVSTVIYWVRDAETPTNSPTGPSAFSTSAAPGSVQSSPASTSASGDGQTYASAAFTIDRSAMPAGSTLQMWLQNPAQKNAPSYPYEFDILPAGAPHC